jgi:hypothetical protein
LFDAPLVVGVCWRVEQGGHRCVVVAVMGAHVVTFAGLAEFSNAYWRTVSSNR